MGFDVSKDTYFGGATMTEQEIKIGSVGISKSAHQLLVGLVQDNKKYFEDRPFESIVEAFRFAFALGYNNSTKKKREGKHVTVAPRQFVVTEYLELLREEVISSGQSLGGLISDYAEGGCMIISNQVIGNKYILALLE
jgi:hypothetical protein